MEDRLDSRNESFKTALGGLMLVTAALLACATSESINEKYKGQLMTRAKFDMNCERLSAQALQTNDAGVVRSYGVSGCGKQATYLLSNDGVWVMNTDGRSTGGNQPPPAAVQAAEPVDP
jgi:hypothetical protein